MASKTRAEEDAARNLQNLEAVSEAVRLLFEQRANRIMARVAKKTLEVNARTFFALVKKQFFAGLHVTIVAESTDFYSKYFDERSIQTENSSAIQSTLKQFLKKHPVPLLQLQFDFRQPPQSRWTMHVQDFSVEVKKKRISQRKLKHFARVPGVGIVAMATNTLCCDYNKELGQFTSLEDIEFELTPRERDQEEKDKKRAGAKYKSPYAVVKPAFLAGEFRCVQSAREIQVTGPPERSEILRTKNAIEVVGLHVWSEDVAILLTRPKVGYSYLTIYTIDTRAQDVTQQATMFEGYQSQMARVDGTDEQALFVLQGNLVAEFRHRPDGFFKAKTFGGFLQEPFLVKLTCFHVGQKYLCIGTEFFVSFYDMDDVSATQESHVSMEAKFHIRCLDPVEMFFVDADETQILVSSETGVELWTLP